MVRISDDLSHAVFVAIQSAKLAGDLPPLDVPVVRVLPAAKPEMGDYTTPVSMQIANLARQAPLQIASVIVRHLEKPNFIDRVDVVGGYINFHLSTRWLQEQVDMILVAGKKFWDSGENHGKRAQVECVSANPTGPITIGRVRGGVIGDTLARLLRTVGYEIELEYYYNNAGAQMERLGESVQARYLEKLGQVVTFPPEGYQGEYIYDIADALIAEKGNEYEKTDDLGMFRSFAEEYVSSRQKVSLQRIGIVFDNYFSEQSLYQDGSVWMVLKKLEEKGLVYRAQQPEREADYRAPSAEEIDDVGMGEAVWLRTMKLRGIGTDRALVKSSGEPTYRLPDIAYHVNKLERGYDLAVNVLGADHIEQFKDVKAAIQALGYDSERIKVVLHQFVTLLQDGKPARMSTREGHYVLLDDILDNVGSDAIRYFMLAHSPDSRIDFDLDLARKQSNENPVYYIQNAHVRCASIARVAAERGIDHSEGDVYLLDHPIELALIRKMVQIQEIIALSLSEMSPHKIAIWAHQELASVFHQAYEEARALHESVSPEVMKARLKLYAAARIAFASTLALMGMSAPDQM